MPNPQVVTKEFQAGWRGKEDTMAPENRLRSNQEQCHPHGQQSLLFWPQEERTPQGGKAAGKIRETKIHGCQKHRLPRCSEHNMTPANGNSVLWVLIKATFLANCFFFPSQNFSANIMSIKVHCCVHWNYSQSPMRLNETLTSVREDKRGKQGIILMAGSGMDNLYEYNLRRLIFPCSWYTLEID